MIEILLSISFITVPILIILIMFTPKNNKKNEKKDKELINNLDNCIQEVTNLFCNLTK